MPTPRSGTAPQTARPLVPSWLPISSALLIAIGFAGCSSGLGNNLPTTATAASTPAANLPTGIDLGVTPTDPVDDPQVAGATLPGIGGASAREVVFTAFQTASPANDADGMGTPLARETTTDSNGATDVFVSATVADAIDTSAFSQSLAGKMRHPRCTTCHSMAVPGTTAFATGNGHEGPLPGGTFPVGDANTCLNCHGRSAGTTSPVDDWKAPASTFDLRTETVAALAARAKVPPTGDTEHFITDPRVIWAFNSGVTPFVGTGNSAGDNDHDGVVEPEDTDGIPRPVPGGSTQFISEFEAWEAGGEVVTTAAAVQDVALVSRLNGSATAGNGASRNASMVYVTNSGFDATDTASALGSNPMGWLYITYESDASDLVGGDGNGASDVFWLRFNVNAEQDAQGNTSAGSINLEYDAGSLTQVSSPTGGASFGNGASSAPSIGGANGQFVAFQSLATNLQGGFADGNGAGNPDVYLREIGSGDTTRLISHVLGNAAQGGDGASSAPAVAAAGDVVAYQSTATDLIATDTNGNTDVFYADASGAAPFTTVRASVQTGGAEATGGDSTVPSVYSDGAGRVKVAFVSANTALVASTDAAQNVFLHDSTGTSTINLNAKNTPSDGAVPGDGTASDPSISADGNAVVFLTESTNLDVLRNDRNSSSDVVLVELNQVEATGLVLPFRINVTATSGDEADRGSRKPVFGRFASSTNYPQGFAAYLTDARNLGTSDSTDLMVSFLAETSGVTANFTPSASKVATPFTVTFTDNSSGAPTSWQWDFQNDGNVDSTDQNPTFTFPGPGAYTVKLTAANANTSGETTQTINAVGPLAVDFTADATVGAAPFTVNFTDATTQLPDSWAWDFDGNMTTDSAVQNPSHTYNTPGTYDVSLTATGVQGSDSTTKSSFIQVFNPVSAGFTVDVDNGLAPLTVNFTNTSTGDIASVSWDFDTDGNADSTQTSPQNIYSLAGTFTATLTVTGQGGDVDTATDTITVTSSVSFSKSTHAVYTGQSITYTPTPVGNATQYQWDIDGNAGNGFEITRNSGDANFNDPVMQTYNTPGSFTIRFQAVTPGGTVGATDSVAIVASSLNANVINPSADNTIFSDTIADDADGTRRDNSAGGQSSMYVGYINNPSGSSTPTNRGNRRALVKFNLTGASIPADSTILTAQFQVTIPAGGFGTHTLSLHRLTTDWGEGSVATGLGKGGEAATGDATWNEARHNVTNWTNGGSFVSASASASNVTTGTVSWSGSGVVSDVQDWFDGSETNAGWIIISNLEDGGSVAPVARKINSRTGATPPTLTITYRPPLPAP